MRSIGASALHSSCAKDWAERRRPRPSLRYVSLRELAFFAAVGEFAREPVDLIGPGATGSACGFGAFARLVTRSPPRSEEHTSELQSLMRISYAVFCLKKK